jgi:hypothetical protein
LHRTFQEYFTACYLSNHSNGIELAKKQLWAFEWHEIITLMAEIRVEPLPINLGSQWTAKQKAKQAALICNWQPWQHSTGAKTEQGKWRG